MLLKFHAKPGQSCAWPNTYFPGQARRFLGRKFIPGDAEKKTSARYEASTEPVEVPSDSAVAAHFMRKCLKGEIWAADEATAAACGVEFVALARDADGEWFPASEKKPAATGGNKSASKKD